MPRFHSQECFSNPTKSQSQESNDANECSHTGTYIPSGVGAEGGNKGHGQTMLERGEGEEGIGWMSFGCD